jgi:hypothetical protein
MTNQTALLDKYRQPISDLRRLVRAPFETSPELLRFRRRVANERGRAHRRILERTPPKHMSIWSQFWRMHDVAMLPNATSQPNC